MPKPIKTYSVCFLFTPDCRRVLLQRKARTGFAGRLNGVGGKIEPGETAFEGALREIKEYGFALRLSLNLTDRFSQYENRPWDLFRACKDLGADQVTLRVLYSSGTGTPQDAWIAENAMPRDSASGLQAYVKGHGRVLGVLPHGAVKYSLNGLCVVTDNDCMDKTEKTGEDYKYLILQPDCRLYSQWDDPASLIF